MAKAENKVKFGLKNVHYALLTESDDGAVTFGTPKPIPGAVNLNLPAQGDTTKFYADNVAYYVAVANDGYQGDLEIARVPDSYAQDVLKESLDSKESVLIEHSDVEPAPHALLFEFAGDKHATRHVLYNCTCARPTVAGATTTNTKEPGTSTLTITAAPLSNGMVKARTTANTPDATVNNWYKSVWQPTAGEE